LGALLESNFHYQVSYKMYVLISPVSILTQLILILTCGTMGLCIPSLNIMRPGSSLTGDI